MERKNRPHRSRRWKIILPLVLGIVLMAMIYLQISYITFKEFEIEDCSHYSRGLTSLIAERIIDVELKSLYARIEQIGYRINLSDEAKAFVASKGYDVQFGARPLKRAIQNYIEDGISDIVVELAKYDSFIEFIDNRQGNPADVTSVEYQRTDNGVMKINVRTDDKGLSFLIPTGPLEEEVKAQSDRYEAENVTFPRINSDWVISLFTEPQGEA